jgi:cobalt/nickel transport protein
VKQKNFYITGFVLALFLAGGVSFYASSHPDGLEKVATDIGFIDKAKNTATESGPLAGYEVKGIDNSRISTGAAGIIGVVATGAASMGLFMLVRRTSKDKQ